MRSSGLSARGRIETRGIGSTGRYAVTVFLPALAGRIETFTVTP